MARALKMCSTKGCPNLVATGCCPACSTTAERARGTSKERGYNSPQWRAARRTCLISQPLCVCTDDGHGHDGRTCMRQSDVADHWPHSRKDLIALGIVDLDAQSRLRGICSSCHNRHSAGSQPGGWNAPTEDR